MSMTKRKFCKGFRFNGECQQPRSQTYIIDAAMIRRRLWFLSLLLLLILLLKVCSAQELPLYTTPEAFNYTISRRQNVCDRQQHFHRGQVELRHALSGLELRAWMPVSTIGISSLDPISGAIPTEGLPGLEVEILDEVAKRGNFTWRNSFGVSNVDRIAELGKTFDDALLWAVNTYDISAASFTKTLGRISQGGTFPQGYIDASTIMIGKQTEQQRINLWGFLAPFSWQVWLMILATYVLSGMLYQWMEWVNEKSDRQKLGDKPTETIYFAALAFVGDNNFQPHTDYARMFIAGLLFFSMLVGSAYTANLASFLVIRNTPTIQVQTINDAVQADYLICTIIGTPQDVEVTKSYPKARLVRIDAAVEGEGGLYLGVVRGDCDIALTSVNSWEKFKGQSTFNPDCDLNWVGRVVRFRQGGFVTKSDSGTLCTSLIRDVFNLHMVEMEEQEFTSGVVKKYYEGASDQQCEISISEQQANQNSAALKRQLGLQDMGGLFICFYVLAVITAIVALVTRQGAKWRILVKNESDDSCNRTPSSTQDDPNITPEGAPKFDDARNSRSDQQQIEAQPPVVADEDALLAQLDILQRDLKEAMRQASGLKRSKPDVYTPVQYNI